MASTREPRHALALSLLASGGAGLGYQLVWTQQLALQLGAELPALLAVVAAFFGGMALGSLVLGTRAERSLRPRAWFVGAELMLAAWSCGVLLLMPTLTGWSRALDAGTGSTFLRWLWTFTPTFCLLLPATLAMGVTLPALERVCRGWVKPGRNLARLYAANTLGAVLGVLGGALWAMPALGLRNTSLLCAVLNLCAAALAFRTLPRQLPLEALKGATRASGQRDGAVLGTSAVAWKLAATGLLAIGYEVLVVRVLSQVSENTVYTYALLLAVYLVGTAAGAGLYQRVSERSRHVPSERSLLALVALSCLLGGASLWGAERTQALVRDSGGPGFGSALLAELVPALLAFGAPALTMGMLFSALARRASQADVGLARALAANTAGSALAPLLVGVLAMPALGAKGTLLLLVGGYALLGATGGGGAVRWLSPIGAAVVGFVAPPLQLVDVPSEGRLVSYETGPAADVSVVEDAGGISTLRINNRAQEGSSATQLVDGRQAWLPLLLQQAPRRALFLGLGTGVTAASAAQDPSLQVEAVELLPEVARASHHFSGAVSEEAYARVRITVADARRFVTTTPDHFDVIVADNYHPARSGSGALYTVEHFLAIRARLTQQGVFCQWLPLHQLDRPTLASITRSYLAVFPHASALLASNSLETPVLGLVGRRDELGFSPEQLRARLATAGGRVRLQALALEDELAVLGSLVAGPEALSKLGEAAELNTDDHPVVQYLAPRATYSPEASPRRRLLDLLGELSVTPEGVLLSSASAAFRARLAAYWSARASYLRAGRDVQPAARVQDLLAQVERPLLSVLKESPDFRPAYDPLLGMARALAQSDSAAAVRLLRELSSVQPARREASDALIALGAEEAAAFAPAP